MPNRFWSFRNLDEDERVLTIDGVIAENSWWDDDVTPAEFRSELNAGSGPLTLWINSPGGDVVAAAQIYNMLREYSGRVTVKIDGIAASAASVIAMAGDRVLMSPVGLMMIHNPWMMAYGDAAELDRAARALDAVKESIINAYERKTGLSRKKLSDLMDEEKWMDANEAVELGFADGVIEQEEKTAMLNRMVAHAGRIAAMSFRNKVVSQKGRSYSTADLRRDLDNISRI